MTRVVRQSLVKSVLIIDDEFLIANALAHMLRAAGYDADLARDGKEALGMVSSVPYDLVICDVRMPVMDGIEFYAHLKRLRPDLAKRVAFCTGDLDNPRTRDFLQNCGVPFLQKPFRLRGLLDIVDGMLSVGSWQMPHASDLQSMGQPALT